MDAALFLIFVAILFLTLPWLIASAAIVAVAVGDSLSAVFGKHFGKHKIFYNRQKSWWGAIMGFMGCYIALFFLLGRELALATAFVAMLVESSVIRDNFGIPIAVVVFLIMVGV